MSTYKKYTTLLHSYALAVLFITAACDKQNEWLDVKSNKSTVTPQTLADFQAVLDYDLFNTGYSTAGLVGTDNLSLSDVNYTSASEDTRNLYIWNKEIWADGTSGMWSIPYRTIECTNIVLDGMAKKNFSGNEYNNIKGQALFFRALMYFNLSHLFCKPYSSNANEDLGLPIRLTSDVNEILQRSTLEELYNRIVQDASEAANLLNETQPSFKRPVKATANALLAKIYLTTGDYESSRKYARLCLKTYPGLLDFNNSELANLNMEYRFPELGRNNPEILLYAEGNNYTETMPFTYSLGTVAKELYEMYDERDLRKTLFYTLVAQLPKLRGTYTGKPQNFCGIGTNEVYLILAECEARLGHKDEAMKQLGLLLKNRYRPNEAPLYSPVTADQALEIILRERRKELPFVGDLRWQDLRRLNKDPRFQTTIHRTINNVAYTLQPEDVRYVLPIPANEIQLTGLQQNNR